MQALVPRCSVLPIFAVACCLIAGVARADALDDIKARGKMVVAIDPTFTPYEYTTANGAITGYDPSLLNLIAKDLGVAVEYRQLAFDGIIPGLVAGSFDFTATALNVTVERAKRIAFTTPVSKSQNVVLARKGGTLTGATAEDLSGHTLAVKAATQPEQLLRRMSKDLEQQGKKPIEILSVQTVEQTVEALVANRADGAVDDMTVMTAVMKRHTGQFQITGNIGDAVYIAWGTRQSDPKLTQAIDDGIKKLKADGRMKALQEQFLDVSFDLPTSGLLPK